MTAARPAPLRNPVSEGNTSGLNVTPEKAVRSRTAADKWPRWREIKFAPKDGRDVLLCREGERRVYVGYWSRPDRWWIEGGQITFAPTHFIELPDALGAPKVGEVA